LYDLGVEPWEVQELLLFSKKSIPTLGPTQLPIQWIPSSVREVNRPGSKLDILPPSSAEVMNEWSHTSTHFICLHGVQRDSFNFTNHSFCSLSYERSVASSKASSPQGAI
jgi:hypothetical protein